MTEEITLWDTKKRTSKQQVFFIGRRFNPVSCYPYQNFNKYFSSSALDVINLLYYDNCLCIGDK